MLNKAARTFLIQSNKQSALFIVILILLLPQGAEANFYFSKGEAIPECYEMSLNGVEPVENQYGTSHFQIKSISAIPEWLNRLKMGEQFTFRIQYKATHCRPFYIFIHPIAKNMQNVTQFSSPSPVFIPGKNINGEYIAFLGYQRKPNSDALEESVSIDGLRISFVDYGTSHEVASFEFAIHVSWLNEQHYPVVTETQFTRPMCINDYLWPDEYLPPRSFCSNSIDFPLQEGYEVKQSIDLNADGICELIVQAEYCRKTHDNTCYLLYEERDGRFQKIFHYYNELEFFETYNGYAIIGAMEYGPIYSTYRMGEYREGKYRTTYMRHPCKKKN